MNVTFTDTKEVAKNFAPKPANQFIPEWYKKIESYLSDGKKPLGKGTTASTIKKCMPVFDSIVQGYIITTYTDIYVTMKKAIDEDGSEKIIPWYEWPTNDVIEFHPVQQAPTHPNANGFPYPKLMNPWAIKTPKGYSTMFIPPVHRENIFSILPGVVDTDTYFAPVNFPMVLSNPNFEGLIPAGTPIVQVIPFKRDVWKMELNEDLDLKEINNISVTVRSKFFDNYKTFFRQEKEYR